MSHATAASRAAAAVRAARTAPAAKAPRAKATERHRAADRRSKLLAFLADPPRDVLAAAQQVGLARAQYGEDTERELADLETGQHVLLRRRASASR